MSFVVQGEITIDADGAVRGVQVSKGQLKELDGAAQKAERQLQGAIKTTAGIGRTSQASAGQVANLQAQFNDIGTMMASGQSPLQLALQQGTQVNQVLAQMGGGAGAVRALGSSFKAMINPMSLATLGIIAGGTALVQWTSRALSAGEGTETFEDRISRLSEAIDEYSRYAATAELSTDELIDKFGDAGGAAGEAAAILAEATRNDAVEELEGSVASLAETFGGFSDDLVAADASRGFFANLLDKDAVGLVTEYANTVQVIRTELDLTEDQAEGVAGALRAFSSAGSLEEQVTAGVELNRQLLAVFGSAKNIPPELKDANLQAQRLVLQAAEMAGETDRTASAADALAKAVTRAQLAYQASRAAGARARGEAEDMLATLREQNAIQLATLRHGEDSVEVTALRNSAERRALEATLATLDVSESLKDEIRQVHEFQLSIASADMTTGISPAVDEAKKLAENLGVALNVAMTMQNMSGEQDGGPGRGSAMQEWNQRRGITDLSTLPTLSMPPTRSGGGGARAARDQAGAVEDLVATLRQELAVTRELDPVLREMLGYREQLEAATVEERAQVEELIRLRLEEQATLERQQQNWAFWGQAAKTALTDVNSALDMVLDSLLEASLLGTGPLGALLGGTDESGAGGLLGMIVGAFAPERAEGGVILGQGGGRDDKQLIRASPGEYIVNAQATARNRALLDAVNYGPPAFARGGVVGGGAAAAAMGRAPETPAVTVIVEGASGGEDLEARAYAGAQRALEEYDARTLPIRFREIAENPERIG